MLTQSFIPVKTVYYYIVCSIKVIVLLVLSQYNFLAWFSEKKETCIITCNF